MAKLVQSKFIFQYTIFLLILCFSAVSQAKKINPSDYGFTYKNPYIATATVAILKGRSHESVWDHNPVKKRNLEVEIYSGRNHFFLLEGKGRLKYRFFQQPTDAPLIIIIAGTGASAYEGYISYIGDFLSDQGFHILALPSPMTWNFALSSSESGFPGHPEADSEDLYKAIKYTLRDVKRRFNVKVNKIGLLGFSQGGLYSAHISNIESKRQEIGISTYLMVNPPANLLWTVERLAQMANLSKTWSPEIIKKIKASAFAIVSKALERDIDDPQYFSNLDDEIKLTDNQLAFLLANRIQSTVGDMVYVQEIVHNLGILKTPLTRGRRSKRLKEASSFNFKKYLNLIFLPRLSGWMRNMDLETLWENASIWKLEAQLRNNENIYLIHNQDDFLISSKDLEKLNYTMGDRALIYPYGGHIGNIWHPENKKAMLAIFKSLTSH